MNNFRLALIYMSSFRVYSVPLQIDIWIIALEDSRWLSAFIWCVGWVNELVGGQHAGANGFMFFGVNVDLTETGIGWLVVWLTSTMLL